jgi:regulator of protease activity HflC (stomatin/prohibitin superfamily)
VALTFLIPMAVVAVLLVGAFALLRLAFKVVVSNEWEFALLYVDGRFVRELPPGRHRPFSLNRTILIQRVAKWPQMQASTNVEVLTSDRFSLRLGAMTMFRIIDARKVTEEHQQVGQKLAQAVNEALVVAAAERSLETLLAERPGLGEAIQSGVVAKIPEVEILSLTLHQLQLPPETRRLLTEVERAKLEAQGAMERARGEHAALRSLANAARLLKDNPELMRLRTLQALSPTGKGATLVLGQDALAPLGRASGSDAAAATT